MSFEHFRFRHLPIDFTDDENTYVREFYDKFAHYVRDPDAVFLEPGARMTNDSLLHFLIDRDFINFKRAARFQLAVLRTNTTKESQ